MSNTLSATQGTSNALYHLAQRVIPSAMAAGPGDMFPTLADPTKPHPWLGALVVIVKILISTVVFLLIPWTFKASGMMLNATAGAVGGLAAGARKKFGESRVGQRLQAPKIRKAALTKGKIERKQLQKITGGGTIGRKLGITPEGKGWKGKIGKGLQATRLGMRPSGVSGELGAMQEALVKDAEQGQTGLSLEDKENIMTGKGGWMQRLKNAGKNPDFQSRAAYRSLVESGQLGRTRWGKW